MLSKRKSVTVTQKSAKTSRQGTHISPEKIIADLYKSGLSMLEPQTREELYIHVYKELSKLVGANYVSIYIVQDEELRKVYTSNPQLKHIQPRKDGFTYRAYKENIPYILDNKNVVKIHPEIIKELQIPSTLFIPLTYNLEPIGVISADFLHDVAFPPYVLDALKLFGSIITYKMKNLELQEELVNTVENQSLFISLASHEIKNPLTAVQAYVSLIQRQLNNGKKVQPHVLNLLINEVQRTTQLINELLNTDRQSETNVLQYKKSINLLRKIIDHSITNFHFTHPKRSISFENLLKKEYTVYADSHKIIQIFSNLLNNADKFSPQKSQIQIVLRKEKNYLCVKVADKGKGINKADLPYIFNRFYKGNTKRSGMGLGLYLCKKIIEDHNGKIKVSSTYGKGTTFTVYFPIYS